MLCHSARAAFGFLSRARALNATNEFVFEGAKSGRPLSDMTFTKLLRDVGLNGRATGHGFRSSFKVWCSEVVRAPDEVSEAAQAHAIKDRVKAAYLRTEFLDQRRPLMAAWERHWGSGRREASCCDVSVELTDQAA